MQTGGFDPEYGIQICANVVADKKQMEETLAHGNPRMITFCSKAGRRLTVILEMVHAYDHLRFKVDWEQNLRHAACTEIRASSLSGECRWVREVFTRGKWKLARQHQECVRRRAILSVAGRPFCKDDVQAAKVVNEVWDSCFADTRPFDEIYR